MLMECSKTQGNELWTQPPQLHLFYEKPWKRKLKHYGRETNFFVKGFKETLSFENMHLKETHFFMYVKKWKHDLKKKKKRERIFENTFYIFFFEASGPLKEKGKRNYFLRIKFRTPPYFLENIFFF